MTAPVLIGQNLKKKDVLGLYKAFRKYLEHSKTGLGFYKMIAQNGELGGLTGLSKICPVLTEMKKAGLFYDVKSFIYCKNMSVNRQFLDKLIKYSKNIKIKMFICFSFASYKNAKLLMYVIFGIAKTTTFEYQQNIVNIYEIS